MTKLDPSVFAADAEDKIKKIGKALSDEAVAAESSLKDEKGSCEVSVWTTTTCYDNHTLKSCAKLGVDMGGVSSFNPGSKCPDA